MTQNQQIMFIFPGQGAQYVGMGSDLIQDFTVAKQLYQKANDIVGYDLTKVCLYGPENELKLTKYTQPALLTHSLSCLAVFNELTSNKFQPVLTAGHSLGEYCALVTAGSLDFETALSIVQKRGEYMSNYGKGEMLVFPLHQEEISTLAEKHFCAVAAINLPNQTVVGGLSDDLDRLVEEAHVYYPKKRPTRIKTEGAFHTFYMVSAALRFRKILDDANIKSPTVKVLSNYTGSYHDHIPSLIKTRLFFQLFHPVNWFKNIEIAIKSNITSIVEFGGGIGNGILPEDKHPNLEGIIKKAQRGTNYCIQYYPAISSKTLYTVSKLMT